MFIAYLLSRYNHKTNRDEEIPGMKITINAIESCMDIPDCMTTEKIRSLKKPYMSLFPDNTGQAKAISHGIPGEFWEYVIADIFTINNKHYLCNVDYHSKFVVIK